MATPLKKWTPRETNLVYEWSTKFFPKSLQWRKVRVGALPNLPNKKMYGILRRYVDLVIKYKDTIYLVEAKMNAEPTAIGQLLLYKKLFVETDEFTEFKDMPIKLIFLTTFEDKAVKELADSQGIDYVVYAPLWVKEYLNTRRGAGK